MPANKKNKRINANTNKKNTVNWYVRSDAHVLMTLTTLTTTNGLFSLFLCFSVGSWLISVAVNLIFSFDKFYRSRCKLADPHFIQWRNDNSKYKNFVWRSTWWRTIATNSRIKLKFLIKLSPIIIDFTNWNLCEICHIQLAAEK